MSVPPTVVQLKSWSRVDFSGLDSPFTDSDLQTELDRAVAYMAAVTGQTMDDTVLSPPLIPMAEEATQLRVEQMVYQSQPDYLETVTDDAIQSFSAGSYTETRVEQSGRARGNPIGYPMINPLVRLNQIIWLLCTSDMRDYWRMILQGNPIPSTATTEVDWGNYDGLYPYSTQGEAFDPMVWGG